MDIVKDSQAFEEYEMAMEWSGCNQLDYACVMAYAKEYPLTALAKLTADDYDFVARNYFQWSDAQ